MLPKRFDLLKGFGTDYMLNLTGVTFRNFRVNAEGNQSFLNDLVSFLDVLRRCPPGGRKV